MSNNLAFSPKVQQDAAHFKQYVASVRDSYINEGFSEFPVQTLTQIENRFAALEQCADLKSAQSVYNKAVFDYIHEAYYAQPHLLHPTDLDWGISITLRPQSPISLRNIVERIPVFGQSSPLAPTQLKNNLQSPPKKADGCEQMVDDDFDELNYELFEVLKPNSAVKIEGAIRIADRILDDLLGGLVNHLQSIDQRR